MHTPDVQAQGIKVKVVERGGCLQPGPEFTLQLGPCWLWTLKVIFLVSVSLPVKWDSNAYLK